MLDTLNTIELPESDNSAPAMPGLAARNDKEVNRELAALRQASGLGVDGFLYLLRATGPTLLAAQWLEICSASYRSGDLTLEVHAGSLAAI